MPKYGRRAASDGGHVGVKFYPARCAVRVASLSGPANGSARGSESSSRAPCTQSARTQQIWHTPLDRQPKEARGHLAAAQAVAGPAAGFISSVASGLGSVQQLVPARFRRAQFEDFSLEDVPEQSDAGARAQEGAQAGQTGRRSAAPEVRAAKVYAERQNSQDVTLIGSLCYVI